MIQIGIRDWERGKVKGSSLKLEVGKRMGVRNRT